MNIDALNLIDNSVEWSALYGWELLNKLLKNIIIANYLDVEDWGKLNGANWVYLLREQPQFGGFCDWSKLDGTDWCYLLRAQPQFSNFCDWSKLDGADWQWLLSKQPQFGTHCDWGKISSSDLACVLRDQPQLIIYKRN